jgi:hypothetical protein
VLVLVIDPTRCRSAITNYDYGLDYEYDDEHEHEHEYDDEHEQEEPRGRDLEHPCVGLGWRIDST